MTEEIRLYTSFDKTADFHLAWEEYLMKQVSEKSSILFLWSNEPVVVIGRNQNPWKECNLKAMERDGVELSRRKSGGGAVYQDLGNINISFLCHESNYEQELQTRLWLDTLAGLGIRAEVSGRNDIVFEDGRKCTGMAFSQSGEVCLQHGTIMLSVDLERLKDYLTVSKDKLVTKGIDSVSSRVGNLQEFCPNLTRENLVGRIEQVLQSLYPETVIKKEPLDDFGKEEWERIYQKYQSWEWKYGRKMQFTWEREKRFSWGNLQIQMQIENGIIVDARFYSDGIEAGYIENLQSRLKGIPFDSNAIEAAWNEPAQGWIQKKEVVWRIKEDILQFLLG